MSAPGALPDHVKPASTPKRRALLIGSTAGNLEGPKNDVETMSRVLARYEFSVDDQTLVKKLCGPDATRKSILDAWNALIDESSNEDVVVIYYSGHGGFSKRPAKSVSNVNNHRFQFLVPHGFDGSLKDQWTGILDSEISKLLLRTTTKTQNVTYILDCCHSERLGRGPSQLLDARLKGDISADFSIISDHAKKLRDAGDLLETESWSNNAVVRIAACADTEPAWECRRPDQEYAGLLTENLALLLDQPSCQSSWRNLMLEVAVLVETASAEAERPQRPSSAGAHTRIPFSATRDWSQALLADVGAEKIRIRGGEVHGIRVGDRFSLTPLTSNQQRESSTSIEVTVSLVNGFSCFPRHFSTTFFGLALARPKQRTRQWTAAVLVEGLEGQRIREEVEKDQFFRLVDEDSLIQFHLREGPDREILLYAHKVQRASRKWKGDQDIREIISSARKFAEAEQFLSLQGGNDNEEIAPNWKVQIGVVNSDRTRREIFSYDSQSKLAPEPFDLGVAEDFYMRVERSSDPRLWFNVFRVDAAGNIVKITKSWPKGFDLGQEISSQTLLGTEGAEGDGISLSWPPGVPNDAAIPESFMFVLTNREMDLSYLETSSLQQDVTEKVQKAIRKGSSSEFATSDATRYKVLRVRYTLGPTTAAGRAAHTEVQASGEQEKKLEDIPDLDETERGMEVSRELTQYTGVTRGILGASFRALRSIKPFIWVVNTHTHGITVVVSKYGPIRQLTGAGVTISPPGVGLNVEFTTFGSKSTKKTLEPMRACPDKAIAVFPLWSTYDKFGVISISKDAGETWYIENDSAPVGSTVYFTNRPNLTVVEYGGKIL